MVDYTLTPNKSLIKPNRGTYVDTWDVPINSDWDYIDRALGGKYTIGVQAAPANPVVLTIDDARYQQIAIANQTAIISVQLPLVEGSSTVAAGGMWVVDNNSNTFDVNLSTLAPGTNTLTLKAGKRYTVFSNGSGVFFADDSRLEASATSGLKIVGNAISIEGTNSVLTTARGGTGFSNGYTSGQLLIGKADGTLARATLTAGTNVTITNGDGAITINSTASGGGTGGLTSIGLNTTLSGLSFDPSTLNSTATSTTLKGTLGISSGGTGTSFGAPNVNPGIVKLSGVALTSVSNIDIGTETSGTLGVGRGGTGTTTWTVNTKGVGAVWASSASVLTSGTLPATAGGTGLAGVAAANQAIYSSGVDTFTTGVLPPQAGGTGLLGVDVANKAIYSLGLNVFTAGTLPVAAGGTNKTSWTLNGSNVGAVWADTAGSLTSGTLPVTAGGTGLSTVTAANQAIYSSNLNTLTAGTLPVAAGGSGVTTATGTGTGANNVLSIGPTLTGLTTVERISATATGTNDAITSKIGTDTNFTYIGKNSAGANTFTVTGSGNANLSGILNANSVSVIVSGAGAIANSVSYFLTNEPGTGKWASEMGTNNTPVLLVRNNVATASLNLISFRNSNGFLGGIYTDTAGTGISITYSSDYRLKENIIDCENGLNTIKKLRPVNFKWKSDPSGYVTTGFIAHEVQSIIPHAVIGQKDATEEDGSIRAQGIDNIYIVPYLVAAVKELTARVEALEAKIAQM